MSLLPSVGVHMLLVSVTICCLNANQAQAVLAGAAVLPHGDFVYDPSLVHNRNGSLELHNAAKRVGAWLQDLSVDVVFMTTPHGLADDTNFLLYRNTNGSGYALIGQDLHNASFPSYKVPLHASLAPNVTKALTHLLSSEHGQNVSGLTGFGDGDDMPLRWGEVIPLSFLEPHLNASHTQVAILSMPSRRYTQDALMIGELERVGAIIANFFEASPLRVAWIVSCDLAHTHLASGPYGFSKAAEPFDKACGTWASTLQSHLLVDTAKSLVDKALSCGFTGLVMLDGALAAVGKHKFEPALHAIAHPTYYGMMVASMKRTA